MRYGMVVRWQGPVMWCGGAVRWCGDVLISGVRYPLVRIAECAVASVSNIV